jgi:hypothetical protein
MFRVGAVNAGIIVVLELTGPDHLEGLGTVEVDAGCRLYVQTRVGVEQRHRKRHVDATEVGHDIGELVEIDLDRVLDRDPEILFDGRHQLGRAFVEPGVDLVGPLGAGVRNEQIARDGEQGQLMGGRIRVEDHDHVAVDAVDGC